MFMTDRSDNSLAALLRKQILASGPIPFVEFMQQALYHPAHGYYMTPRQRIGKLGDFFTSSSVHALFGQLVARQLRQMWELLGQGAFSIVEQGAGEGHFALDILSALQTETPEFYRQLDYVLLEVSPDNRRRQQEVLQAHTERVRWSELEQLGELQGCFLSNELIDAFPVRLLEKQQGELKEVFVGLDPQGAFCELMQAPQDAAVADHLDWLGVQPFEGNRFEVNLAAIAWMRQVAGMLKRGFVLTIDYGYPAEELYAPFRRDGTLMCYRQHRADEDPLQDIGAKDITAHVDFTALQQAGAESGLSSLCFIEQYRFLMGLGFVEALMALQQQTTDEQQARVLRLSLKNLIMPEGGMGETFKVLIQAKGVDAPELLCQRDISLLSAAF
jgi:SAM-dependent MidA family methyltransferase